MALFTLACACLQASAQPEDPATLVSPVQGSVLPGSTVTFAWTPVDGALGYTLYVGTTGTGAGDIFKSTSTTATSLTVAGIPQNGVVVYVRLSTNFNGTWEHIDSTYFEAGAAKLASLTAPAPGSRLSGSSATFSWTSGTGVTAYQLHVGTTGFGSSDVFDSNKLTATSVAVSGIPTNGSTLYVRLFSMVNGAWRSSDFTIIEAGTPAPVSLSSPSPGSTFTGSTVTFSWTPGSATVYKLYLGTTGTGSNNLFNSGSINTTSATVSGIPACGNTVFVRLYWQTSGSWNYSDYAFLEAGKPSAATIVSPAPGSQFSGVNVDFSWTAGTGVSAYKLYLGTAGAGSTNLYNSGSVASTSIGVSGLPVKGVIVYARLLSCVNGQWEPMDYTFVEAGTPAPASLLLPVPGSQLAGKSVAFSWNTGVGPSHFMLYVGSKGAGSSNLYNSGSITGTSAAVSGLPANGATIFARLSSMINGSWQYVDYTYLAASPSASLSAISCSNTSITGSATDACTVTLTAAAPSGGMSVALASSGGAVTVPSPLTVPAGATGAAFAASVSAVTTAQTVTLTASAGSVTKAFSLQLNAATPALGLSTTSLAFGNVAVNGTSSQPLTLNSTGNMPVTVSSATVTGAGFSVSGVTFPITLNPGQSATLSVRFNPVQSGAASGSIAFASNSSSSTPTVSLGGTGTVVPSALSCGTTTFTGAGSAACSATLNAAAPSGGTIVSLASTSSAVTVPASVTVAAGATGASFAATVASVSTAQTATITATAGGASSTVTLQLNAATPTLTLSAASVSFGSVVVNTPVTQTVALSSSGNVPVTVNSATVTGAGFSISGVTFPVTLNPGQSPTLTVQFDPIQSGAASGTVTFSSNSSSGSSSVVNLSGTGAVILTDLSCATSSYTGSGTDTCTVTLNAAAPSGGTVVSLASNNSAVTVPASVTVPAGATGASFTATVSQVSSAQSANLTAAFGTSTKTFALQLNACAQTLTVSASSIAFGSVMLNVPATQTITLTSTGSAAVTINSATLTGAGFSLPAPTFPVTLNPGQALALEIEFDPSAAGAVTGQLSIANNSSTSAIVVTLTGTGMEASYQVALSWAAPSSPNDPIAGYNVYCAPSGTTMFHLMNSSIDTGTGYVDTTVQSGSNYDYYVETVDTSGHLSIPSSVVTMTIP